MGCGCNKERKCKCPFCDAELEMSCFEPLFCKPCNVELVVCAQCGASYAKKLTECPSCKKK